LYTITLHLPAIATTALFESAIILIVVLLRRFAKLSLFGIGLDLAVVGLALGGLCALHAGSHPRPTLWCNYAGIVLAQSCFCIITSGCYRFAVRSFWERMGSNPESPGTGHFRRGVTLLFALPAVLLGTFIPVLPLACFFRIQ
jgi:hypothetical protein